MITFDTFGISCQLSSILEYHGNFRQPIYAKDITDTDDRHTHEPKVNALVIIYYTAPARDLIKLTVQKVEFL